MSTSTKGDLVKYTRGAGSFWKIALGALIAFYFLYFFSVTLIKFTTAVYERLMLLILLLPAGYGILLVWRGVSYLRKYTVCVREAESSGEMQTVLADFSRSRSMVHNNIRLGEKYIFGKGKGYPVSYSEINKVYQSIIRRGFFESERRLNVVVNGGGTRTLCNLKLRGKSDKDMLEIVDYIRQQNPNVNARLNSI